MQAAGLTCATWRRASKSLEEIFVDLVARAVGGRGMNLRAIAAIYRFEMARTFRTLGQSVVSPVLSTSLYFVVFGAAIGSRIEEVEGVSYGAFIVPGLIMLTVLTQAISNASFGIYFPKVHRHDLRASVGTRSVSSR
jgi:ABC-type multidrug transport system permease subunit